MPPRSTWSDALGTRAAYPGHELVSAAEGWTASPDSSRLKWWVSPLGQVTSNASRPGAMAWVYVPNSGVASKAQSLPASWNTKPPLPELPPPLPPVPAWGLIVIAKPWGLVYESVPHRLPLASMIAIW